MIFDARQGFKGLVIDLDTGQRIPRVQTLDLERGICEAFQVGTDGKRLYTIGPGGERVALTVTLRGRFKVLPRLAPPSSRIIMGAPKCQRCPSLLTLRGDDLCPACRAKERGQRHTMQAERVHDLLLPQKCAACTRQGVWCVADEVEVTPEQAGRSLYDRGATVGRRYYCARCFQSPRLLDARGDVIQELEGLRPE
jgi:hypothetical protein